MKKHCSSRGATAVHLRWRYREAARAVYMKIKIKESAPRTFFNLIGFRKGYFGIQQRSDSKVIIFSLWDDYECEDEKAVPEERRIKPIYVGLNGRYKRFQGEGTGAQYTTDFNWELNNDVQLLLCACNRENEGRFSAYILNESEWIHLATFATFHRKGEITNIYSFVEDYERTCQSADSCRIAHFGPLFVLSTNDEWIRIYRSRFTYITTKDRKDVLANNSDGDKQSITLGTGGDLKCDRSNGEWIYCLNMSRDVPEILNDVIQKCFQLFQTEN
ncbi:hypothetical protein SNEBB_002220 [Seison nebaliae]|nr:hypothetical protein SNEBB_002220 [Seison nebaliae]